MLYERYRKDLQGEDFLHDTAQQAAVPQIQRIYDELTDQTATTPKIGGLFSRFIGNGQPHKLVRGLYLWGGVGAVRPIW